MRRLVLLVLIAFSFLPPSKAQSEEEAMDSIRSDKRPFWIGLYAGSSTNKKEETQTTRNLVFTLTAGTDLTPHVSVGGGIGLQDYYIPTHLTQLHFSPVFGHIQARLFKTGVTPFIFMNAGYAFNLKGDIRSEFTRTEYSGSTMINTGAGIKFRVRQSNVGIIFGYRSFQATIKDIHSWNGGGYVNEYNRKFNRFEIQIGIEI